MRYSLFIRKKFHLLQNESSYMIETIISHIWLKDTEQGAENTPMATTNAFTVSTFARLY
jgi:hypothetical protein